MERRCRGGPLTGAARAVSPVGGQAAQPLEVHACPGRPPMGCAVSPCMGGGNGSKRTPPSCGTKTPSGTSEWKCGVTCKTEPKNWMNDTAPTCPPLRPCRRALRRCRANTARRKTVRTSESSPTSLSSTRRTRCGKDSVHCRQGTCGSTCSTRCAAVTCARFALQDGHTPRPLHEKATSSSSLQLSQRTRAKP